MKLYFNSGVPFKLPQSSDYKNDGSKDLASYNANLLQPAKIDALQKPCIVFLNCLDAKNW